ncbi:MAG TPA: DNA repair protein RadC [Fimbriimonadaceae bacterium]|nr:DNA repair protein RadC [Fimbriimonadaceae bacterium]
MVGAVSAVERIQQNGLRSASNADLLSVVLARDARDVESCAADAHRLAKKFQGARLLDIGSADLKDAAGLESFESLQRTAAMELGRRAAEAGKGETTLLNDSDAVYAHFARLESEKQEHFCAAYLDSKNGVLSTHTVHIGTVNMSVVGPREVFREAVRENAAALVVAHNHPSGDPSPSPEDIAVTRKLAEVGRLLDIPLLDHIIVGRGTYVSLQREGVL